jgi:hypothetical protein
MDRQLDSEEAEMVIDKIDGLTADIAETRRRVYLNPSWRLAHVGFSVASSTYRNLMTDV